MINMSAVMAHKCRLFPGIGSGGRVLIPTALASSLDPTKGSGHVVPWGALDAACQVLLGRVEAHHAGDRVTLRCASSNGSTRLSGIVLSAGQFTWENGGGTTTPYKLLIAEAALLNQHDELDLRWQALLDALKAGGAELPLSETALAAASHTSQVKSAMFAVVDSLYYSGKLHGARRGAIDADPASPPAFAHTHRLLGNPPPGPSLSEEERRLTLRARGGVRALLVGPTGCGKTELGKRVALATGATLVGVKGRPGLEDRDMIGFISPTVHGARWVDGPLARAMRLAQGGTRVELLIDELLRLDAYHRNALIGMLDDVSAAELRVTLGVDVPEGRYYTLDLPGAGEVLYASTALLSVICTTNAGSAYTQSGDLDPALLRRFQRVMFVDHPSKAEILPVYERHAPSPRVARIAYALEVASRGLTTDHGQVLARGMNIGVTLNLLAEVSALVGLGLGEDEALREALVVTVTPFCCELSAQGVPDVAGVKCLEVGLGQAIKAHPPVLVAEDVRAA